MFKRHHYVIRSHHNRILSYASNQRNYNHATAQLSCLNVFTQQTASVPCQGKEERGGERRIMGRRPAEVKEKGGKRKIRWQGGEERDKG